MNEYRFKGRLRDIQVHLTQNCNHKCIHCYTDSWPQRAAWLPIEAFRMITDFARKDPQCTIRLLGGEVVYPNLEIAQYIDILKKANVAAIVSTNGYVHDVWEKRKLDPTALREIIVSCYGFREAHELVTQIPNSFDRTCKTITYLAGQKPRKYEVTVNTLVTAANRHEFPDFLAWLSMQGVDEVKILVLSPLGRAPKGENTGYDRLHIDSISRDIIRTEIVKDMHQGRFKTMKIVWERNILSSDQSATIPTSACRIHKESMITIDYRGNVYPCHLMVYQEKFSLGNILITPLEKILESYESRGGGVSHQADLLTRFPGCPAYYGYANECSHPTDSKINFCPLHLELLE